MFLDNIRKYTPDTIVRNIKQVKKGVIEVKRYSDAKFRQLILMWLVGVICVWTYDFFTDKYIYNEIEWALIPESRLRPQYEDTKNMLIRNNLDLSVVGSYEEFRDKMINGYKSRTYMGYFYLLFPIGLFLLLCFFRDWRPLRIDTNRRLVYFWWFGRFYIARYEQKNPLSCLHPYMHQPKLSYQEHGALVLTVPHETNPKDKTRVDLGIYRPACDNQHYRLQEFLADYMHSANPDEEFAQYFNKEKHLWTDYLNRIYHFSLVPARGYNEEKTEAKIQEWLEKYGDGQQEDF